MMTNIALVTLLLLVQYLVFMWLCGTARGKATVAAPAVSGNEAYERKYRVQMNTVEQLIVTLPALWICAHYFSENVALILALVFFVGRAIFAVSYYSDPAKRGTGFIIGYLANIGLIGCSLYGLIF